MNVRINSHLQNPDSIDCPEAPSSSTNWHMYHVCKVKRDDGKEGSAILEQCLFGSHKPSGLLGVTDGWTVA